MNHDDDEGEVVAHSTVPADLEMLAALGRWNDWLRALLCTAARRGVALRLREPVRAEQLLVELSRWPWFKGGQFLFDLMEWEDFMVDGSAPPLLPGAFGSRGWSKLTHWLGRLQAAVDIEFEPGSTPLRFADEVEEELTASVGELPPLQPGLHLYRDVALGLFASASTAASRAAEVGLASADEKSDD
jgi:hypothetical protein